MFEAASNFRHPFTAVMPLVRSLKFAEPSHLRPGSILDKGIRASNALMDLPSAFSWLRFLADVERRYELPAAPPDTVLKPLRNFAVHRLGVEERCRLLRAHYTIAPKALPARAFAALWTGSRIPLGTLEGRRGRRYHLILESAAHCGREGEYTFTLIAEDGLELAKLTFVLAAGLIGGDETQLLIGGLQGPSSFFGNSAKERVISATRDLSGFRPKMAVFVAASTFAEAVGASNLLAVSNRTHTINADAWYQRRRLVADYDAFWVERGGKPTDYGFQIPLRLAPRTNCMARNRQRSRIVDLTAAFFAADR